MLINTPYLRPSGLNSSFHGNNGSFQDYIQHMQNIIQMARLDLTPTNAHTIVSANSPFEFRPLQPTRKGILLAHGLYDSPLSLRDIGQHWVSKGYLVRGLLLPGHGTVPGDLLTMHYEEWIKALNFGINSFQEQVDELYVGGFSTGATLAILAALTSKPIKGLLLFAPALKPKPIAGHFIRLHQLLFRWIVEVRGWYKYHVQQSYGRYESYNYNAAKQTTKLMKQTLAQLKRQTLQLPLFMVLSNDDESISSKAALALFNKNHNYKSRLLFYTNQKDHFADSRILTKPSCYPEQKILDFSHTCIPIAPNNPHYGSAGDYRDFHHYGHHFKHEEKEIHHGAISDRNLRSYTIQRLSYNPDFENMMAEADRFLENL